MVGKNRDSKYKKLFPEYIRQKIKKKHNIRKRFIETRVQKTYLEYYRVKNKVKNMITYFRKQKERNISMDINKNPKTFWKYISMKAKTKSDITALYCDLMDESSRLTNNDIQKSNLLNDYFASVFTHVPHGYVPSMDNRTNEVMLYEAIKNKDIESLLKNIDGTKAPSPDGYHPCFVKELAEFLSEPLGISFRSSVKSVNIPTQWKETRLSATYKKESKNWLAIISQLALLVSYAEF